MAPQTIAYPHGCKLYHSSVTMKILGAFKFVDEIRIDSISIC